MSYLATFGGQKSGPDEVQAVWGFFRRSDLRLGSLVPAIDDCPGTNPVPGPSIKESPDPPHTVPIREVSPFLSLMAT